MQTNRRFRITPQEAQIRSIGIQRELAGQKKKPNYSKSIVSRAKQALTQPLREYRGFSLRDVKTGLGSMFRSK